MHTMLRSVFVISLLVTMTSSTMADSTSVVKFSLTTRSRIETTDYASTLGLPQSPTSTAGSSYVRNRTGLMTQLFPASHWEIAIRFTNEFRRYLVPAGQVFTFDEVVIDQLFAKADSLGGTPFSATLGRQNISLGEGFLVAEGGPSDGSRTAYFNAINLNWQFSKKTNLRFIYANQQKNDDILPIIHDQHKVLAEGDEQGVILYLTTSLSNVTLEPYLMHKERNSSSKLPHASIICVGLREQTRLAPRLTATSELAIQTGNAGGEDHRAIGGYSYFEYKTNWPTYYPSSFTMGGVYLSGDDNSSVKNEGWEPMFGRYPKWSESYVYTLTNEYGVAYWSNFASLFGKVSGSLGKDITLNVEYHHSMAPEPVGETFSSRRIFQGASGKVRGDLAIVKLNYLIKPRLSGHLLYEQFNPGSFYAEDAKVSSWVRMEALLTF